jgi:hypothetical protein
MGRRRRVRAAGLGVADPENLGRLRTQVLFRFGLHAIAHPTLATWGRQGLWGGTTWARWDRTEATSTKASCIPLGATTTDTNFGVPTGQREAIGRKPTGFNRFGALDPNQLGCHFAARVMRGRPWPWARKAPAMSRPEQGSPADLRRMRGRWVNELATCIQNPSSGGRSDEGSFTTRGQTFLRSQYL